MYYKNEGKSVCADVIPFYENGEFKLFYLNDYRDIPNEGEGCPWNLLTTKNFIDYVDHGPVLLRGNKDEQDLYVFTGSCVKFNNKYYIFYTGHNPHMRSQGKPEQKILMATSLDLINWKKEKDFVFEAPSWMEMHDFRDPYVYYDENKKKYGMLLAGRFKNNMPTFTKGATFVAYSDDLYKWEVSKEPFYNPEAFYTHECPDLFKMGDWWYLLFSEFTDKIATRYRMAKSIDGPWITPKEDTFDGHGCYAAKTASDGKRRILFGWNAIKLNYEDNNWWQWGGNIICHELVQKEDGTLFVKCPDEIKQSYNNQISLKEGYKQGEIEIKNNEYIIGSNHGMSIQMFNEMPKDCKIELEFTTTDEIGDFGLILREMNNFDFFYKIKIEPYHNRLGFDKIPRRDFTLYTQVDVERYYHFEVGKKNKITIIVEESVLEVFINDEVAMGARMYDFKRGNFGVYAQNTKIIYENIKISKR